MWAEIEIFLQQIKSSRSKHFENKKFIGAFACESDTFSHLNILNLQMQRTILTVIEACDRVQSFKAKLDMWRRVQSRIVANFPAFEKWKIIENCNDFSKQKLRYVNTLQLRKTAFEGTIFDCIALWIILPFDASLEKIDDNDNGTDELIDLQSSTSLWSLFSWSNGDNSKFCNDQYL